MSSIRTVDQISSEIDQEEKLMYIHQKNGNYADAEKSRLKIEQFKKDLEARTVYEMEMRHKREYNELSKANSDELASYNSLMDQRNNEVNLEAERSEKELLAKHKQQLEALRKELEVELSPRVKESSELLNLRKMEEHMVKQKNFAQAHDVQQLIFAREKAEKSSWLEKRDEKIQVALNTLRTKQNIELASLRKRFKALSDQLTTDRKNQIDRLQKKHENFHKDLKSQQDKQILNYKGEFRSKGGKDSPLRLKSSFTN